MGRSIINWGGGVTDNQLSDSSDHPLTNKAATAEFLRQQNLITQKENDLKTLITQEINKIKTMAATTIARGMTQLSTSASVTDTNAYALSAIEKNAGIGGTLANQIANTRSDMTGHSNNLYNDMLNRITGANNNLNTLNNIIGRFSIEDGRTLIYTGNLNDIRHTSIYNCNYDIPNFPAKWVNWCFVITLVHAYVHDYRTQIGITMNDPSALPMCLRYRTIGGWNAWRYFGTS